MENRETVLVTGASGGIGEALAECFASNGFDLVLVARSADKLESLAQRLVREYNVSVKAMPADLARTGAAGRLFRALRKKELTTDVLINNAGILEQGEFVGVSARRHQELISLNIAALTDMIAHFLPPMIDQAQGRILNVASIAAFQPIPSLATYAATKSYVLSLTESLSEELRGTGVSITALCPGITATDMVSTVQKANDRMARIPGFLIGTAQEVAQEGFDACMRDEVIRVPGVLNLATTLATRASPRWLVRRIAGLMGR